MIRTSQTQALNHIQADTAQTSFAGAFLAGAVLSNLNLTGADFRGADLHKQLERAALQRLFDFFQALSFVPDGAPRQALNSPHTKV